MGNDIESILLDRKLFQDLKIYCNRFGKDFSAITSYFEQNPYQLSFVTSGRRMRLPAQIVLKKVLGMPVEDAQKAAYIDLSQDSDS